MEYTMNPGFYQKYCSLSKVSVPTKDKDSINLAMNPKKSNYNHNQSDAWMGAMEKFELQLNRLCSLNYSVYGKRTWQNQLGCLINIAAENKHVIPDCKNKFLRSILDASGPGGNKALRPSRIVLKMGVFVEIFRASQLKELKEDKKILEEFERYSTRMTKLHQSDKKLQPYFKQIQSLYAECQQKTNKIIPLVPKPIKTPIMPLMSKPMRTPIMPLMSKPMRTPIMPLMPMRARPECTESINTSSIQCELKALLNDHNEVPKIIQRIRQHIVNKPKLETQAMISTILNMSAIQNYSGAGHAGHLLLNAFCTLMEDRDINHEFRTGYNSSILVQEFNRLMNSTTKKRFEDFLTVRTRLQAVLPRQDFRGLDEMASKRFNGKGKGRYQWPKQFSSNFKPCVSKTRNNTCQVPPSVPVIPRFAAVPPSVPGISRSAAVPVIPSFAVAPPSVPVIPRFAVVPPSVPGIPSFAVVSPSVPVIPHSAAVPGIPRTAAVPPSVPVIPRFAVVPPPVPGISRSAVVPPSVPVIPRFAVVPPSVPVIPSFAVVPPSVPVIPHSAAVPPSPPRYMADPRLRKITREHERNPIFDMSNTYLPPLEPQVPLPQLSLSMSDSDEEIQLCDLFEEPFEPQPMEPITKLPIPPLKDDLNDFLKSCREENLQLIQPKPVEISAQTTSEVESPKIADSFMASVGSTNVNSKRKRPSSPEIEVVCTKKSNSPNFFVDYLQRRDEIVKRTIEKTKATPSSSSAWKQLGNYTAPTLIDPCGNHSTAINKINAVSGGSWTFSFMPSKDRIVRDSSSPTVPVPQPVSKPKPSKLVEELKKKLLKTQVRNQLTTPNPNSNYKDVQLPPDFSIDDFVDEIFAASFKKVEVKAINGKWCVIVSHNREIPRKINNTNSIVQLFSILESKNLKF